jgi:DNA-binding NtrC family response regulator
MTYRTLLLDDDEAVRSATAGLLELEAYHVVEARCVAEARRHIAGASFDVVILDRHLPDGDGTELVADIGEHCPRALVVLLSGDASGALPQGVHLLAAKGDSPLTMLSKIATRLAERRASARDSTPGRD